MRAGAASWRAPSRAALLAELLRLAGLDEQGVGGPDVGDRSVSLLRRNAEQLAGLQLFLDQQQPTIIRTDGISGAVTTQARCEQKPKKARKKKKTKECTLTGSGTSLATPEVTMTGNRLTVGWR